MHNLFGFRRLNSDSVTKADVSLKRCYQDSESDQTAACDLWFQVRAMKSKHCFLAAKNISEARIARTHCSHQFSHSYISDTVSSKNYILFGNLVRRGAVARLAAPPNSPWQRLPPCWNTWKEKKMF